MMNATALDVEALQRGLDVEPTDRLTRFALADYYEEHGDEGRAQFHRDLAAMGRAPTRHLFVGQTYHRWYWWRGSFGSFTSNLGWRLPSYATEPGPFWFTKDGHQGRRQAEEHLFEAWAPIRGTVLSDFAKYQRELEKEMGDREVIG